MGESCALQLLIPNRLLKQVHQRLLVFLSKVLAIRAAHSGSSSTNAWLQPASRTTRVKRNACADGNAHKP